MVGTPFQAALEALLAPLAFAARDDFANVARVRDLEATVAEAARRAGQLALPRDARDALRAVERRFAEPLDAAGRGAAVAFALDELGPYSASHWAEAALTRGTEVLPGVGPKRAEALARRSLATVEDLLFHLPHRYDDRRELSSVGDLEVGRRATFVGRVLVSDYVARRGRGGRRGGRIFEAVIGDDSGTVNLKWFHGGDAIASTARKGALLLVTGDVKRYRFNKEILHPEIESLPDADADAEGDDLEALRSVVADYATPEGLHPRGLRRAVLAAVAQYADLVGGHLPEDLVRERGLPEPAVALRTLHAPDVDVDVGALRSGAHPAHTRLVLEELYLLEAGLALRRAARGREAGIAVRGGRSGLEAARAALPFQLTAAQTRVLDEIVADLERPHPMQRLLEGDVGSGKTVVAYLAAVAVGASGHQTALMAPTELLAEQHARTLERLAASLQSDGLRTALLTSSVPRTEADRIRTALAAGALDLVVGTHALLQESVSFRRLACVVIDEQHRFGVRQRAALAEKSAGGLSPHTLVMTATPIPRTLALTAYGDLDLSVLDEMPPGRSPARTLLLREGEGEHVVSLLRETTARGEQAYVVYPLVEESEKLDLRSASESAERIRRAFPELRIDLVHGRLDAAERARAMARFEAGDTQVLVSTTVIEVGVDVPNATLMIVEHAERFGLAQLHQLRGRVGRGERAGTCVLVARGASEDSEARLAALLDTTDGFRIAEADLLIRGPGEFLGTRQHGRLPDLRIADLVRDAGLVAVAREAALHTVRADPGLARQPELRRAVEQRWGDRLQLASTG